MGGRMLDRILQYMKKYNMVEPGDKIIIGVSGGADSLALLNIFHEIKALFSLQLVAAHVHHGLRGKDADADAEFVEQICRDWQIPFYLKRADVRKLAADWGISEEEAGRRVRYEFFDQLLRDLNGQKIALGHHRDDQAETILFNLIRGTGIKGLQGMKPVREGKIIRPLLQISKEEIEQYCYEKGLKFRVDATNEENVYVRNRIRNVVIPYIKKHFNPNFSDSLVRMGDILAEEDQFLSCYTEELFNKWATISAGEISIPLEFLNDCCKAIRRRVIRLAVERMAGSMKDISYTHIEQILNIALDSSVGSMLDLPGNLRVKKDYEMLCFSSSKNSDSFSAFQYPIPVPGRVHIEDLNVEITCRRVDRPDVLNRGPWCIYIDSDKIKGSLWVRNRRDGDRFQPLGMKGTKKLKDYFIDRKIPRDQRDAIPLVVDESNIVWVAGYQLNDNYKVTPNTTNVLELKIYKH